MKTLTKFLLLIATLLPTLGNAQDYPSKVVTIVIPFSPGGSNDAIGRFLAEALQRHWKQTVVAENRSGAGSLIGTQYVANSPADGYKLLLVSSSFTTSAATRAEQSFDPLKALTPAGMVARGDVAVVTGSRVPMATLADLAREAKTKTIFFATAGVGSSQHFNGELLNDVMGIQMTPVPYRGGNEGLLDLAAGRVDVVVGTLGGMMNHIQAGRAKAIAVLGKTRAKAMPNVPTTAEAGYPAALTENVWAVFAPAGTPEAVITKINQGIKAVTHTPEGRKFLTTLDSEPTNMSPAEVGEYTKKEVEYWTKLAKKLNISTK